MSAIALPMRAGAIRSTVTASVRTPKAALRFAPLKKSVAIRSRAVAPLSRRSLVVRAAKEEETTSPAFDADDIIKTLQEKWDATENKGSVFVYGGGAIVAIWFSSTIVGAVNSIPLLPKLMELVGLGYSTWFVYRYLLFKSSRKDLIADVEELKAKITGTQE
mmetsp:Transcript_36974/g.80550  ORF Transcript_36974/g.80550 Transcript_36974/m.80550 type:complete len:162 (-) Transcript_36974:269-754(-)|eukprot:CAMPEP_0118930706 /NCGR_PEP_ID=MMETSP1169-20130426/7300_1 /TAXON_ID=36882 /ORGANISM="Pyramimonas obovata, Strain CCMP722" /LENGTH=161 /DNA_ID=CAMNT_0006873099 /DNA_START=73 /DNA_END=558 /DNA_ORIENTATION=+